MTNELDVQAEVVGQPRWFTVTAWGMGMYALSLLLPAAEYSLGPFGSESVPGWAAALTFLAWGESVFQGLSGTTNLLMFWSLRMFRAKWRNPSKRVGVALLVSFVLNLGWLYEPVSDVSLGEIRVGYYTWLASYVLVGVGHLYAVARRPQVDPNKRSAQ